jgi:hypothetical protein
MVDSLNTTITSVVEATSTESGEYRRWMDEIAKACEETKTWHHRGSKILKAFVDDRSGAIDSQDKKFNLFTTNVGILQAALYSNIPKVRVERKFQDMDDNIARVAANIMQRAITQDLDETDCDFSQVMEDAIEDRLVPGAGFAWLRLEVETEEIPAPVPTTPDPNVDMGTPEPAETADAPEMMEQITNQAIIVEHVHWEDFLWSPCRTWAERRWVGRRVYMDRDSLVKRFGEEKGKAIPLNYTPNSSDKVEKNTPTNDLIKKAIVFEIWDRTKREVIWVSAGYDGLLDKVDDPLELEGFEPCPRPLFALTTTSNCKPVPDYYLLQDQYKELNDINDRIASLHRAVKVIGVYDKGADGVQRMLSEGSDNQLIPVDNWAMFSEKGGIKGTVDWLPLDVVVQALAQLRQAREDIKGQIYELNGISDVVRGASKASETLGAQQIKAQYASIRIQRLQGSVAKFAGEIFRIKAEIIAKHFTPEVIIKMSGIEHTPDFEDKQVLEQAMALIKNEESFEWRVSVDSSSMKMADYAQEKKERTEYVTAVSTYLQSSATILQATPEATPLVLGLLKYATAASEANKDIEALIDKTVADYEKKAANPEPPPPDPEMEKMKMEQQMAQETHQADMQAKQADMQMKQVDISLKTQAEQQKLRMDMERHQYEMQCERDKHALEMQQLQQEGALKLEIQRQQAEQKSFYERLKAKITNRGEPNDR